MGVSGVLSFRILLVVCFCEDDVDLLVLVLGLLLWL